MCKQTFLNCNCTNCDYQHKCFNINMKFDSAVMLSHNYQQTLYLSMFPSSNISTVANKFVVLIPDVLYLLIIVMYDLL